MIGLFAIIDEATSILYHGLHRHIKLIYFSIFRNIKLAGILFHRGPLEPSMSLSIRLLIWVALLFAPLQVGIPTIPSYPLSARSQLSLGLPFLQCYLYAMTNLIELSIYSFPSVEIVAALYPIIAYRTKLSLFFLPAYIHSLLLGSWNLPRISRAH
jgi:hypothetical protein